MEQLTVVGQTPEGDALVLVGTSGVQYVVPIDSALRAAVRGDRPGLERAKVEGELRPRDIQALIRAGASVQRVATESGLSVEHVTRYAAPVLDERAFVAQQARDLPIGSGDDSPTLGELIPARLAQRNIPTHDLDWDAWRNPDGWMVSCSFYVGGDEMSATWRVDLPAHALEPADAEAHMLSAPEQPDTPLPRRLRAVSDAPVFDFAALSPADIPAAAEVPDDETPGDTSSLLDELAAQRGQRVQIDLDELRFPDGPAPEQEDAQVLSFSSRRRTPQPAQTDDNEPEDGKPADRTPITQPPAGQDAGAGPGHPAPTPEPTVRIGTHADQPGPERYRDHPSVPRDTLAPRPPVPAQPTIEREPDPEPDPEPEPPKPSGRGKRAKVPSWNEIVFGTTPQE